MGARMLTTSVDTPIGPLSITEDAGAIVSLGWSWQGTAQSAVLDRAVAQLRAYFAHELTEFDLPLRVAGSAFQRAVCAEMQAIPMGDTCEYGDIARRLGKSAQAVGNACGANPIPVIIPCHRVLGAQGLGGFSGAGGVETKVALLRHEGAAGLLI